MIYRLTGLAAISLLLAACAAPSKPLPPPSAAAPLLARSNSKVAGTVYFKQVGDHVEVKVEATRLKPEQAHGFHIHEVGDCTAADAMSAGGHFNPTGKPHGPQNAEHHGGDMPALMADSTGFASATFHLTGVTIKEGPNSIVGRSVIVHRDPDDYKTQPTGNSGARIACGVIARL